jgi:hypothetical protein
MWEILWLGECASHVLFYRRVYQGSRSLGEQSLSLGPHISRFRGGAR